MSVLRTEPVQKGPISPLPSSELLHYGGSAAAIIIAIAILLRAIGDMLKVLVPVMLQRTLHGHDSYRHPNQSQPDQAKSEKAIKEHRHTSSPPDHTATCRGL